MGETVTRLYVVAFSRDAMVVKSAPVRKETPKYFVIETDRDDRYLFGYGSRITKGRYATTERDALARYISERTTDKENAAAVMHQASEQIAQAEALFATADPAMEPVGA